MHPDTMQSAPRAAAAVPESVARPEPVVALRTEAPDRRMPPGQSLVKSNRKEKGTNSVLGTYQFSCGGECIDGRRHFCNESVGRLSGKSRHKLPNRERTCRMVALTRDLDVVASRVAARVSAVLFFAWYIAQTRYVCALSNLLIRHYDFVLSNSIQLLGLLLNHLG